MYELTANKVRKLLVQHATLNGSQKALADKIGCSTSYLSEIINSTREPAGPILEWLKLERQVRYVPVNGKTRKAK